MGKEKGVSLMFGLSGGISGGAGGISPSSSSSATNGDFQGGGTGNVTFYNGTSVPQTSGGQIQKYLMFGLVFLLVVMLWKK
ncbi:hypothetical protein [Vibrio sp. SCSIO 43137]|uniref:hypothetical protein n=1 Tax=Vibrio sp. SCSIO 43137 TaxID=3021011 RepID=UPI002306ED2E|nr:hypothetical protein [Vibrio sp. SCSIO 43137]WCE29968.1 hypothetical protein PK654_01255 [Vibrio sp. SCSIO 43137]